MIEAKQSSELDSELPIIGIMVLNQNGEQWLPQLFESLRQQDYPRLKLYLVDNASTDTSVQLTQTKYPEVKVIRFSQNAGYCMAYNRAMPIAFTDGCEWIVWANNDVLLEPDCLREMGRVATENSGVGVIGPAFICWESNEPNYYMKGNHSAAITAMRQGSVAPIDVSWVEGSFLMVSRKCIDDVGGLDPFLFFYWEETDFCRRALRNNWRVVLTPRALARHYAGGWSAGHKGNTSTANYLKSRNQYIYTLADPNRSFFYNLFECAHLFVVLIKSALKVSPESVVYELRAFLRLLPEIGQIWGKWRRDKCGIPPEATTRNYANISVYISGQF